MGALVTVLEEGWARRARSAGPLQAYRLMHGEADGAPWGWAVDRFGDCLVLRAPDEEAAQREVGFIRALQDASLAQGAVLKLRETHGSRVLFGDVPERMVLPEGPARLELRLVEGYQVGLFLEGRSLRASIGDRRFPPGSDVLSLFSYTGSASLRAALAGARVTSVDAARRAHAWARRNFELSGVTPDAHRWFADDAMRVLGRSPDDRWAAIIMDPPSFGRAGRRDFRFDRDFPSLALEGLRSSPLIFFSCHDPLASFESLSRVWQSAARRLGTGIRVERAAPNFDFPESGADWGAYHHGMVIERSRS